jgi:hypothetical protein
MTFSEREDSVCRECAVVPKPTASARLKSVRVYDGIDRRPRRG